MSTQTDFHVNYQGTADRRRHVRFNCKQLNCDGGDVFDVSASGVCLQWSTCPPNAIQPGDVVTLSFCWSDRTTRINAEVVWYRPQEKSHQCGLIYVDVNSEAARGLAAMIEFCRLNGVS